MTVSVPNTFVAASDAVATEVNANFDALVQYINNSVVWTSGTQTITGTQSINNLTVTGTLTAEGNLNVDGTLKGDVVASNGSSVVLSNGTDGSDATFKGDVLNASGTTIVDVSAATFAGNATTATTTTGNAATATGWASDLTINLGTDLSGSVTFNGDENTVTLNASVVNDSHTHDGRYYTETESDARFLGINATAADSDELGGQAAANYLRSNADDTTTGRLTIDNSNVGSAGNQAINILDTSSQGLAGISFRYTNNSPVQHGIFRMSNASVHRFVFLQENNASLADAQLQNLYYSGSLTSTSDETLKNNEGPALGLSFVNRLAPFTGTWIDGDDEKHQFLGAQSVEAALTAEGVNADNYGLIGDDSEIGPRTMSYIELVPVLVQAVNDLTARLEAVEAA